VSYQSNHSVGLAGAVLETTAQGFVFVTVLLVMLIQSQADNISCFQAIAAATSPAV
jgi:hypothetical protein